MPRRRKIKVTYGLTPEQLEKRREKNRIRTRLFRQRLPPEKLEEIKKQNRIRSRNKRVTLTPEQLEEQRKRHRLRARSKQKILSEEESYHFYRRNQIAKIFRKLCGETREETLARKERDGVLAYKTYKSLCVISNVRDSILNKDKPQSQDESCSDPQTSGNIVIASSKDHPSSTYKLNNSSKPSTTRILAEENSEKAGSSIENRLETGSEKNSRAQEGDETEPQPSTTNVLEDCIKEELEDKGYLPEEDEWPTWDEEEDDEDEDWLDYDSNVNSTFHRRRIDETISEWTLRVGGNEDEDSNGQNPPKKKEVKDSKTEENKKDVLPQASSKDKQYPSNVIETEEERAQRWKDELERRIAYYCKILGEKKGEEVVEKFKKNVTYSLFVEQRFIYNHETKRWDEIIQERTKKPRPVVQPKSDGQKKQSRKESKKQADFNRFSKLTPEENEVRKAKSAADARMKTRMDKEEWRIFEALTSLDPLTIMEDETAQEAFEYWCKYSAKKCPTEVKLWREKLYPLFTSKPSETETEDEKFQRYEKIIETVNACVTKYGEIVKEHLLAKKEYLQKYISRNPAIWKRTETQEEKELLRLRRNAYFRERHRIRKGLPPLENCQPVDRKKGRQRKRKIEDMTEAEKKEEIRKWDSYMRERYRSKKDDPSFVNEEEEPPQNKRPKIKKTDGETPTKSTQKSPITRRSRSATAKRKKGEEKRECTSEIVHAPEELDSNSMGEDNSMKNNYDDDDHNDEDWTPIGTYEIDAMLRNAAMEHPQVIGNAVMELNRSAPAPSPVQDNQRCFINELNVSSSTFHPPSTSTHFQQEQVIEPLLPPQLSHNLHNIPNNFHFYFCNQTQHLESFPSQPQIPWNQNYLAASTTSIHSASQLLPNPPLQRIFEGHSTRSLRNRNYTVVDDVQERVLEKPNSEHSNGPTKESGGPNYIYNVVPAPAAAGTTKESTEEPPKQSSSANDPNEALKEMEDRQRPMCPHCSKYFETQSACDKHVKKVHESPIPFACKLCCRGFPNTKDLIHHICISHYDQNQDSSSNKKHCSNESMQFCSFCGILIKWSDHLDLHTLLFHPKEYEGWLSRNNSVDKNEQDEDILFSCETCDSEFRTEDFLAKHIELVGHSRSNNSVVIFKCTSCHKMFSSKMLRDYHFIQDCSLKVVKCLQCEESFPNHNILLEHVLVTHTKNPRVDTNIVVPSPPKNKKDYKCELCKRSYGKISLFLSHFSRQHWQFLSVHILEKSSTAMNETHTQIQTTSKDQIDSSIKTSSVVSTNLTEWIEQFVCTCTVCQSYFTGKKIHEIHKAYKRICSKKCDVCDRQFVTIPRLLKHKIDFHKMDSKTAKLVEAVLRAQENAEYTINHSNSTEDGSSESVMCTICFVSLSPSDFHKQHETVGSYSDPAIKSCTFCEKKFIGSFNLLRHTRQFHNFHSGNSTGGDSNSQAVSSNPSHPAFLSNRIVVYPCSVCRTIFNSQKFLAVHLESKHPEVKEATEVEPHGLCELCNKTFSHVENLIKHRKEVHISKMNEELASREFTCKICKKVFDQEVRLRAHMGNVHFPQHFNTFCQFCGKQLRPEYIRRHTKFFHPEHANSITKSESLKVPLVQLLQLLCDIQDGKEKMPNDENVKENTEDDVVGNEGPTEGEDCNEMPLDENKFAKNESDSEQPKPNDMNKLAKALSTSRWPVVLVKNCDTLVDKYANVKELVHSPTNIDDLEDGSIEPKSKRKIKQKKSKTAKTKRSKVKKGSRKCTSSSVSVDPGEELKSVVPPKTNSPVRRSGRRRRGDTHSTPQYKEVDEKSNKSKTLQESEVNEESLELKNDEEKVISLSESEIKDEPIEEMEESIEMPDDMGAWCFFPIPESLDEDEEEMPENDPLRLPCYAKKTD